MLRLIIGGFVGLTLLYGALSIYARSVHREQLENIFDAGGAPGLREDFILEGLEKYRQSLRKRLLVLVYVIPVVLIVATAYVVNHT